MARFILTLILLVSVSVPAFAQNLALEGFNKRFTLVKNAEGKVTAIKLKTAVTRFTIRPLLEQIKSDLLGEQRSFAALSAYEKEAEIQGLLSDLGLEAQGLFDTPGSEEGEKIRESILNVKNINVEEAFLELNKTSFWKEFETKLNEAFLFVDPTIVANLDDARFFYKRQVTFKVVNWALNEAKKRFSQIPVLNLASFVIVRVHDMMMDQRHFHHNMLLHYFETIPEHQLGMTKEEVDHAVSSIYEYRIGVSNIFESNRAVRDWSNYGMNTFYTYVRTGNTKIKGWSAPNHQLGFQEIKKLNFAFAQVKEGGVKKIYHLHANSHMFSQKPSLAFDFAKPQKVKRNRALLNIAGLAMGYIRVSSWVKSSVVSFIHSIYIEQVRLEGALVGHFESTDDPDMIRRVYAQRANFYIVQ